MNYTKLRDGSDKQVVVTELPIMNRELSEVRREKKAACDAFTNCLTLDNSIARNRRLWGKYNFSYLISDKHRIQKSLENQAI